MPITAIVRGPATPTFPDEKTSELHERRYGRDQDRHDETRALKRLRKAEKQFEHRQLDPWERYRALKDLFDMHLDMIEIADRKARFALVVLAALNAVNLVFVARPEVFGIGGRVDGRVIGVYAAVYITVSVYLLTQAIGALRPRAATFIGRVQDATSGATSLPGLRFIGDVVTRTAEQYYEAWTQVEVGQLNREVALHVQWLAGANGEKYRALDRAFRGLTALAALTLTLIFVIVAASLR
jgi:hypothetical protein